MGVKVEREEEEVEKIAASVASYEPADNVVHISVNAPGRIQPPQGYNLTDLGNSERFVANTARSTLLLPVGEVAQC